MIDLHTHTVFSDGQLIPAELARRAKVQGYQALAFTDHADNSNLFWILENIQRLTQTIASFAGIDLFAGVELTHVPAALISKMIDTARMNGAQLVVVHGETLVEPVEEGTNFAAIEARADILAHPGLIRAEDVQLAAENNVALEISTRKGHCLANGHVAMLARKFGARLVINNDAHAPGDLVSNQMRRNIAFGAGLNHEEYARAEANSRAIISKILTNCQSC